MSKLNKLVTNYPVKLTEEEVENLSQTLSAVHTAKDEGKIYRGEGFVNVNNTNNIISLTTEANEKLKQKIPTKVSDLTDSASYQTTAGMDGYLTKTSASENLAPLSITADVEALKNASGDFSLYYEKTETSSKNELSTEFIKYVTTTEFNGVTGDVSTLKSASSNWDKVSDKLDTSAFSSISGNFVIESDLINYATKSDLETTSGKLLTTAQYKTDSATFLTAHQSLDDYATKEYANNASANALSQAETWVENQHYLSSIPNTYALKTDIPTTIAQLTDSGNYYKKTETSSKDELNTAFGLKQYNLTQEQLSAISSVSSIKGTILTGDSNIRTTSAEDGNNIKWTLELTAKPVVTDTTLSGYDGIVATKDSTISSQWNVGIAQAYKEQIESVSSKLTQDVANTLYAPISVTGDVNTLKSLSGVYNTVSTNSGDWLKESDLNEYVTKSDLETTSGELLTTAQYYTDSGTFLTAHQSLEEYATKIYANDASANALSEAKTWVGSQNYLKEVPDTYALKTDIPTTVAQLTDSGNYYKKTETSSKTEITNALNTKLDTTVATQTYQTKAGMVDYLTKNDASTTYQEKGDYLVADDITGKLDKSIYANASGNWENTYNTVKQYSAAGTWLTAHQSLTNYYTKNETSGATELSTEFAKYQVAGDYVTTTLLDTVSSNLNDDIKYVSGQVDNKVNKPTQTGILVYDGDTSAWVSLPAGTTTIVQGQGSITSNYDSSNSTYTVSLVESAENTLNKVNDKIDTTAVADIYQTKADMTNYLTTSDASTTYQPKGNYATTTDISDMATQTWVGQQGFYTKASGDNDYAPISITATVNTLTAASAGWDSKVDKPTTELVDKYLVLRTDSNGDVSGWCDLQEKSYSKSETDGKFVAASNIDTTTLSGDGITEKNKLGVKTDVIATIDYVNSSFLPLSGGTVSGKTTISGSDFNTLAVLRDGQTSTGTIGINDDGGMSFKIEDSNSNTQLNIAPNATMDKRFSVSDNQHSPIAYLIPAVTSTTTAGLTDDGILHIILES